MNPEKLTLYPNWSAYVGSSAPMVTALLGNIGIAAFIGALQSDFNSEKLLLLVCTLHSGDIVMAFGIFSTLFFVAATISFICLQAADFESMTDEKQERFFSNFRLSEEDKKLYYQRCIINARKWFDWANILAFSGLPLLVLTLGSLVYGHVRLVSYIMGFIAIVICKFYLEYMPNSKRRRFISVAIGSILSLISTIFFLSAIFSTIIKS